MLDSDTQELTLAPPPAMPQALALMPSRAEMNTLVEMANAAANGSLSLPAGCTTAASILVKLLLGRELGISPMVALFEIDIIKGKACMPPRLMVAIIRRRGIGDIQVLETDATHCTVKAWRNDRPNDIRTISYTMAEAKKAELSTKENWVRMPAEMLFARCHSRAARMLFQELFAGVAYIAEELGAPDVDENGAVVKLDEKPSPIRRIAATEIIHTPEEAAATAHRMVEAAIAENDSDAPAAAGIRAAQDFAVAPLDIAGTTTPSRLAAANLPAPQPAETEYIGSEQQQRDVIKLLLAELKPTAAQFADHRQRVAGAPSNTPVTFDGLKRLRAYLRNIATIRWARKELGIADEKFIELLKRKGVTADLELTEADAEKIAERLEQSLTPFKLAGWKATLAKLCGEIPAEQEDSTAGKPSSPTTHPSAPSGN